MRSYLQEEFSKRGLTLPGSVERSIDRLYELGEDEILFLEKRGDAR